MKHSAKLILLMAALALVFVLVQSCSDRGTNTSENDLVEDWISGPDTEDHIFSPELIAQVRNEPGYLFWYIYVPRVAMTPQDGGENRPVPLLILLSPEGGDKFFYANHGLAQVADELMSKGLIQPMIIACIGNDQLFGGYFYAGTSPGAGLYDDLMSGRLVSYLEYIFPSIIPSADKRGIGGVGQGGYGAFRAALLNPGMFASISATDGPMDFDGADGNSGFMNYFVEALNEQGVAGQDIALFDSSLAWPYTSLFIGGSMAFSPYITAVTLTPDDDEVIITADSLNAADSTTLVTEIIKDETHDGVGFYFHLPFDMNGAPYAPVWDSLWVPNNLENLLTDADQLAGVNMMIATSPQATFCDYYDQTQSWINTLTGAGFDYPVEVVTYTGYEGHPATGDQYVYDLLKQMLIFHSESFGD